MIQKRSKAIKKDLWENSFVREYFKYRIETYGGKKEFFLFCFQENAIALKRYWL